MGAGIQILLLLLFGLLGSLTARNSKGRSDYPFPQRENRAFRDQHSSKSTSCTGHGKCMCQKTCEADGGVAQLGYCRKDADVCCRLPIHDSGRFKCGGSTADLNTTFQTPYFPASFNGSTQCVFLLYPAPAVTAIKIEFVDVLMSGSVKFGSTRKCLTDVFYVLNIPEAPVEALCDLRNYSTVLFLNESAASTPLQFVFIIQSHQWRVKFRLSQIKSTYTPAWKNEPNCGRQLMFDNPEEEDYDNTLRHNSEVKSGSKDKVLIINGQRAESREFPWQVSIERKDSGSHLCGASVIGRNLLLTAAHCFAGSNELDSLIIRLPSGNETREGDTVEISTIVQHYLYKTFNSHVNDIAVIKLKSNLTYTTQVQPVCLPTYGDFVESGDGIVTGWGWTGGASTGSGTAATHLQKLNVQFITQTDCYERLKESYAIALGRKIHVSQPSRSQLCAIAQKNSTVCFGDSGGPLIRVNASDGTYTQMGVVSYSIDRCVIAHVFPVVYSRVSEFLKFISIAGSSTLD